MIKKCPECGIEKTEENTGYEKFGINKQKEQKEKDLRDYFAAMAMQGLIIADVNALSSNSDISRYSYEMADAMLKEREK